MEELIVDDFSNIVLPPVEFMAKFDPNTGMILAVGPSIAFQDDQYKLPIDQDIAKQIIQGKMLLNSCKVNIEESKVEISEEKSLFKIDDVLHRVSDNQFTDIERIDIHIAYNTESKQFNFSLAEDLGGTKINPLIDNNKKRKLVWAGDTAMHFYITDYNDPNILYQKIEISIAKLEGKTVTVDQLTTVPKEFSVYTRRLFKNYVLEYESN
jgi:hypothetical protein